MSQASLKMTKREKATKAAIDVNTNYTLDQAVSLIKKNATAKFDETIDVSMNLGLDTRQSDQVLRGVVNLPAGSGKTLRVAVFAKGAKAEEAKAAGADIVGAEDLAEEVQKGNINFDRCIATPDMMMVLGKLGKILGPRNLMPNPKLGTVTMDVTKAVNDAKGGSVEYRAEKAGIVHAGIGKASFSEADIRRNLVAFVDTINKAKPAGAKGVYIKKITLSSTMGAGIKLDINEVLAAPAA